MGLVGDMPSHNCQNIWRLQAFPNNSRCPLPKYAVESQEMLTFFCPHLLGLMNGLPWAAAFTDRGTHHPTLCSTSRTRLRCNLTEGVGRAESRKHVKTCKKHTPEVCTLSPCTGFLSPEPGASLRGLPPCERSSTGLPHPGVQVHNSSGSREEKARYLSPSPDTYRASLQATGRASLHCQAVQRGFPPSFSFQDK